MYPPELRPGYRLPQLKAVVLSACLHWPQKIKTLILVLVLCLSSGACSLGGSSSGGDRTPGRGSDHQGSGGQAGDHFVGGKGVGSPASGGGGVHVVCRCGDKPLGQKGETQAQAKARLKQMCEDYFSDTLSKCRVIP